MADYQPNVALQAELGNDFALLKFVDFVLFCGHIGDQRLFSFGDSVDLEALDMTLLLFDDFIDPLGISVNNLLAAS